jgi:hypothetical protein
MKNYPFRILAVRKEGSFKFRRVYSDGKDYPEFGINQTMSSQSATPRNRGACAYTIDGFDITPKHNVNEYGSLDRYIPSLIALNEKIKCTLSES